MRNRGLRMINPQSAIRGARLFDAISYVAAGVAGALTIIARSTRFGAQTAGHAFGDITRAGVLGAIVLRTADHRFLVFRGTGGFLRGYVLFCSSLRADIAENAALDAIVFGHCASGQNRRKPDATANSRGQRESTYEFASVASERSGRLPCCASLTHTRSTSATLQA